jgi:malate synthase
LWQWLKHGGLMLDDGTPLDHALFERALIALPSKLADRMKMPGGARLAEAIALLERMVEADKLDDFLTLPAYEMLA